MSYDALPLEEAAHFLHVAEERLRGCMRRLGIRQRTGILPADLDRVADLLAEPVQVGTTPAQIRHRRALLGLSQRALGQALGCSAASVGEWERGHTPAPHDLDARLAAIERQQITKGA